ncbi:MAG: primosomal protein N' [Thermodesulfobacteriota bacterium]|nr:primosomal protein N' [Thermodesulfobacteriota bacterium]
MTTHSTYIDVAVALPVYQTYTYAVPQSLVSFIAVGKRVLVPFRRRRVTGYILNQSEQTDRKEIKLIFDVLDDEPLFPSSMIPFFIWIADYYIHPVGEVIKCALPGGLNIYDYITLSISKEGEKAVEKNLTTAVEKEILNLLKQKPLRLKGLGRKMKREIPSALLYSMKDRGWIISRRELSAGGTRPLMERYVSLNTPCPSCEGLSAPRKKIVDIIKSESPVSLKNLKTKVPSASRLIKPLEQTGYITIFEKRAYRDPFGDTIEADESLQLTAEQETVVSQVADRLGNGYATYLLAGVTGSGKTEVYMQLAAKAIKKGYSVLVLIPEIALISQMERRFRARFGECVAVLHSGLSAGERYDQWMRIARKEVTIAIGARSAVFSPFSHIGLIIVDEEHDTSYKQEGSLRYHARDLAVVRAKQSSAIALLGSATPSIQSYYNVKTKKFIELNLKNRVEKRPLPEIQMVDLRHSRDKRGFRRFITPELYKAMTQAISQGEQVLLFLNRRGFASFPVCGTCGEAVRCKNCDISLTLHQKSNAYKCHYCGFTRAFASSCQACGSNKIVQLGLGTEKVEAAVAGLFPDAGIKRMDRDTTTRKGAIIKLLKGLRKGTIDILVGTQMVTKGHDFPNITLVGIICADLSLNFPDFRAGERTFQLLAQVAGRAGRGDVPGKVILQTYNPEHFSIIAARNQDFKAFYQTEIGFRQALNYPPFSRMVQLKISGKNPQQTRQHAQVLGDLCRNVQADHPSFLKSVEILGPIEASIPRIARRYRWQILLKGMGAKPLHQFILRVLLNNSAQFRNRYVKVVVDVDPVFMM